MNNQALAVLWAQWRTVRNFYPRSSLGGKVFSLLVGLLWYGMWSGAAIGVAMLLSSPPPATSLKLILPAGLLFAFLYWQIVPILMATAGASLEIKKLLAYPIPADQLFRLEVLLRISTGIEMLLVLLGATAGLILNPSMPWWTPLALAPFIIFNLCIAAGLKQLLGRALARKRIREITIFLLVLVAALPQLLVSTGPPKRIPRLFSVPPSNLWPWAAAGRLASGDASLGAAICLLAWTAAAYWFGRWQFERGLVFDADEANATDSRPTRSDSWAERFFRMPSLLFRDPLAALIEKELRFLSRSPRFRLVFFMGFSFGLLIWLPLAFGKTNSPDSIFATNYLTVVSVYALMLLGDVLFWNSMGFDRSAAQIYYVTPVKIPTVMLAKNLTAGIFVFLEISAVALVCAVLRMPITPAKVLEAYSVAAVLSIYLLAIGNVGSIRYPRPINPKQAWRSNSARGFQALLLLLYPVLCIPVFLAYLARYAFESEWAFYGVMLIGAAIGSVIYSVAMESAVNTAEERKEEIISVLSVGEGPVSG